MSDDFPRLIAANAAQVTPKGMKLLNEKIDQESAGLFATHPASRDRIQRAQDEAAPGIFHAEQPSTILFRDFAALSKTCTFDLYRALFGKSFKLSDMHPVEQLLAKQERTVDDFKALNRYLQGTFSLLRPLRLPALSLTEGPGAKALATRVKQTREAMLARLPEHRRLFADYDQADTDWLEAEVADVLLNARIKVSAGDFKQRLTSGPSAMQARAAARTKLERLAPQLAELERLSVERLSAALELARDERVSARIPAIQERLSECERVRNAAAVAGSQIGVWLAVRNRMTVLGALLPRINGGRENAALMGTIEKNISLLVRQIRDLQFELSRVKYPFQHAKAEPTISEYLLPQAFHENDWEAVLSAGGAVVENFPRLYARFWGRLAALAEDVESVLGLVRLPEPPEAPEENA